MNSPAMGRMQKACLRSIVLVWLCGATFSTSSRPLFSIPTLRKDLADLADLAYPMKEYVFPTIVDHFNFRPTPEPFLPLRYLVNSQYFYRRTNNNTSETGPVFFYAGNEDKIEKFINNSGFLFETAQEMGAMVVFAEHRYYGQSYPFGSVQNAFAPFNISFLTVEQAMEDYNTLQLHIRKLWSLPDTTPFIVFGGSYGGNLALWLRLKNPNLWAGAIASSATPLKHLLRETNSFGRIIAQVYANVSSDCPELIREGWKELYSDVQTDKGRERIMKELGLCHPLVAGISLSPHETANSIYDWVYDALETMVQYGYPYPTSFYNPVPAFPFRVACQNMVHKSSTCNCSSAGLVALRAAIDVYFNYTGQAGPCYDLGTNTWYKQNRRRRWMQSPPHSPFPPGETFVAVDDQTLVAWDYQCCTEVYQPMPTDGRTDISLPFVPNRTEYFAYCRKRWGVEPRPNWEEMTFQGSHIGAGSNIFLASGQLDPWRAAGIQSPPRHANPSIIVRIIENGAHHLDLRASNKLDPPSVKGVRAEERLAMLTWIQEWRELYRERLVDVE